MYCDVRVSIETNEWRLGTVNAQYYNTTLWGLGQAATAATSFVSACAGSGWAEGQIYGLFEELSVSW